MAQLGNTYTGRLADIQKQRLSPHHLYFAFDSKQLYTFYEDGTPYLLAPIFGDGSSAETDPIFTTSPAYNITQVQIDSWDLAYSWGNHAEAGYITGITFENLNLAAQTKDIGRIKDSDDVAWSTIKETVTNFHQPIINGSVITFYYVNELGENQTYDIDFGPMLPDLVEDTHITRFEWDIDDLTNNTAIIVDSNGIEYPLSFTHFLQRNEVEDLNTNVNVRDIARVGDVTFQETITYLGQPTISGTILTLHYTDETEIPQSVTVDLADMIPDIVNDVRIQTAVLDEINNQIVITETDGVEHRVNLPDVLTPIEVVDLNDATNTKNIGSVDGQFLQETLTFLGQPTINGTILTIHYTGEDEVLQDASIDLASMIPDIVGDTYISSAVWDDTTNTIVITESNSTVHNITIPDFLRSVVDLNTNTDVHDIASIDDIKIQETVTHFGQPIVNGTKIYFTYLNELNQNQGYNIDLAGMIPDIVGDTYVANFKRDEMQPNKLTIYMNDGTSYSITLLDYITQVDVDSLNTNLSKHEIGRITVQGVSTSLYETVTSFGNPVLEGTVLTFNYINEDNSQQPVSIDLATIIPQIEQGIHIENFWYDETNNTLYIKELNVAEPWSAPLPDGLIETQTTLDIPTLSGTILNIKYTGEDGVQQVQPIDLADILPAISEGFRIENFYFDTVNGRPNHLLIKEVGVTPAWEVDLSKYVVTATELEDGSKDIHQGPDFVVNIPKAYTGFMVQDDFQNDRFPVEDIIRFKGVTFDVDQKMIVVDSDPLPDGLEGQVYYIDKDGTNDVEPDFLLHRGIVVENQEEFDIVAATPFSFEEVYKNWEMYSHGYNANDPNEQSPPVFPAFNVNAGRHVNETLTPEEFYAREAWQYDSANNRVYLTKNYALHTGFYSPKKFGNYTFEATFSAANGDDDTIALLIGFDKDPETGYESTITVTRQLGDSDTSYSVYYNRGQRPDVQRLLLDGTDLAPFAGGAPGLEPWNNGNHTRVRVERVGDIFYIKCSQFKSTVIDDSTLLVLDLNDPILNADGILDKFKTASNVGFSATSQKNATFSDLVFTGMTDYIFWPKREANFPYEFISYETWEYDFTSQQYFLQQPQTVFGEDYFGKGRFVYSYYFDTTWYVNEFDEWIKISGDGEFTEEEIIEIIENNGGTFDQNNFVRRLKIDPTKLISQDIDGVLHYLNTVQGIIIDETEIFLIETGDGEPQEPTEPTEPTDPTEPTEPEPTIQWELLNPMDGATLKSGETITITSVYDGVGSPTKVEHLIDGKVVATITTNLVGQHTSTHVVDDAISTGNHTITSKLYYGIEIEPIIPSVSITIERHHVLKLTSPADGGTYLVGETFNITSILFGDFPNAARIEQLIGPSGGEGTVVHTYYTDFYTEESTPYTIHTAGEYDISLRLYDKQGLLVNTVVTKIITITVVTTEPTPEPEPTITYYPITRHRAGSYKDGNSISVKGDASYIGPLLLERTQADGTIRETEQPIAWAPPSPYLEDDELAVSIPYNEIVEFRVRYNQVKELLVSFTEMPKVKTIWLRANHIGLGTIDVRQCPQLEILDFSDNYIDDILLPTTSPINFVYAGGLQIDWMPPPKLMAKLMAHLVAGTVNNGTFSSSACISDDGAKDHETLISRGWTVSHLSIPLQTPLLVSNSGTSTVGSMTMELMSSTYSWAVVSHPDWIVFNTDSFTPSGPKSNSIQNFVFGFQANNTGIERTGEIHIKKVKDDGNEYWGRAVVTVTQQA